MNEYVITFKYDDQGFMRHIFAENEDDAVGIAFARTRGMVKNFDAKNVHDLGIENINKPKKRNNRVTDFINNHPTPPITMNDAVGGTMGVAVALEDIGEWTPPIPTAPSLTTVTMNQARDIFNALGMQWQSEAWRIGYQFYAAGREYMIIPDVNELNVPAGQVVVGPNNTAIGDHAMDATHYTIPPYVRSSQLGTTDGHPNPSPAPSWARQTWETVVGSPRAG